MNKSLEQVKEFHEVFNHPVGDIKTLEPLKIRQLRIKLLFEELAELAEASDVPRTLTQLCREYEDSIIASLPDGDNVNQIEELDALCDIQYVLNGKIITAGMQEIFDKNFDLVHSNNMSKAHHSISHADETCTKTSMKEGHIQPKGKYMILTNSDGKIIKPWDHQKVALSLNPEA